MCIMWFREFYKLIVILVVTLLSMLNINLSYGIDNKGHIVAVVGSELISSKDLEERLNIAMDEMKIDQSNSQAVNNAKSLTLQTLINEKIYQIEAQKLGITVEDEEVEQGIKLLEELNNLPKGGLSDFLRSNKISMNSLTEQIKSQILQEKLIKAKISPNIKISEQEIDEAVELKIKHDYQVKFRQMLLPVDKDIDNQIKHLQQELNSVKNCDQFFKLTKKVKSTLSEEEFVANIIDLAPHLREIISYLDEGQIGPIINNGKNLYLVMVCNKIYMSNNKDLRSKVSEEIFHKKLYLQTQQYLNNLKSKTHIEYIK